MKTSKTKAYTFPFLGDEWTLYLKRLGKNAGCGEGDVVGKTITINTTYKKDMADTILHELEECAAVVRGYRYNNHEGVVFVMTHKEYTGLVEDCSKVYLSICKQLKL
jgi:hypothetical protein